MLKLTRNWGQGSRAHCLRYSDVPRAWPFWSLRLLSTRWSVGILEGDWGDAYTYIYLPFPFSLSLPSSCFLTAANQKEPMNLNFKVKEEPKEEEPLSTPLPRSSYVFSPEPEVAAPSLPEDPLTPQESKGNVPRRDMSAKAASELLMKLSGTRYTLKYFHSGRFMCKPTGPFPAWLIINPMEMTAGKRRL